MHVIPRTGKIKVENRKDFSKNSRKVFFSCFFTNLGLTKLVELNKILRYRKKNNTVKDREKEEYTSKIRREKDSLAEKSFVERMWKVALELLC